MVVRIDPCLKHGGRAFVASLSLLVACGDSTGGTGDTGTDPTNVTTDPSSPSNPTTDPSNPSTDPTTGAPTTGGSNSNSNSNSDSSSGPDPDTTSPGETSTGETTADDSSSGDTSTGDIKFDVGSGETDTDESTTGLVGLGSCRPSEIYGAAGGFPKFSDPNYANFLEKGVAIVTTNAQEPPFNHVLHIVDISGPVPPPNMNYAAPKYRHPSWTQQNIGKVFGLTLDSDGNIYVAATTVYGANPNPGKIKRIDGVTGAITDFATLPNNGPAFGNLNYDCVSETIYVSSHEDGRIYQLDMAGAIVSTYKHATKDVTLGPANDPGEPNGQFTPLGDERVWAVQSHAGRLYYSIWREDTGRKSPGSNEIWSVGYVDDGGVPDPATAKQEFLAPAYLGQDYSNPVADISFAATGWMLISQRTMYQDNGTTAHQSTTYEFQFNNGAWENKGTTFIIGELPGSAAGGVDHDFAENGYVWMTGDALDFYTPAVVYGLQGTPHAGGDITVSTLIDMDDELQDQDKTEQGDVEVPIPGDADPVPPPQ